MKITNSATAPIRVELFSVVKRKLQDLSLWFPYWINEIVLEYDRDAENPASCAVNRDYLWAVISIGSNFLEVPEDTQNEYLMHELSHLFTLPLYRKAQEILMEDLEVEGPLLKVCLRILCDTMEESTQSLMLTMKKVRGI